MRKYASHGKAIHFPELRSMLSLASNESIGRWLRTHRTVPSCMFMFRSCICRTWLVFLLRGIEVNAMRDVTMSNVNQKKAMSNNHWIAAWVLLQTLLTHRCRCHENFNNRLQTRFFASNAIHKMTELLKRPSFQIHLQCGQQHSASFGFRGSAQFSVTVPIAANFSRERRCHFNLTFSCANHESRRSAREKSADIEHQFFSESHPNPIEMAATGKLATLTGSEWYKIRINIHKSHLHRGECEKFEGFQNANIISISAIT